jgi:DNA-binding NarL/FixJ family response regulator
MPDMPPKAKKRIFLVEDHHMVRQGLELLIDQEPDLEVCGGADNASDALSAIERLLPDAVIVDIGLPRTNGIEFLKNMKALHPEIAAIVLSMHDESVYAQRALRAGALGYVMKRESIEEVIAALRKALAGEYHVSPKVTGAIFHQALGLHGSGNGNSPTSVANLSDRELEVFELLGRGKSTQHIAAELRVSPKTVESHRAHIKEKLQFANAQEMIQHATLWVEHETAGGGDSLPV